MNPSFRKYFIAISASVLAAIPQSIWSCGPDLDRDAAMFSLFGQDMAGSNKGFEPFYYTERFLNGQDSDPMKTDRERNCREWMAAAHGKATIKDINEIQYEAAPDEFTYAAATGRWEPFSDNSFVQWLRRRENSGALQYMVFAKRVEHLQTGDADPWAEGGARMDTGAYDSLAEAALQQCRQPLSPFLRERYAFQAVKLLHYTHFYSTPDTGKKAQVIAAYNTYLRGRKTVVADWGLLYDALAQTDSLQRWLYLVKAFDRTEEKKVYVFQFLDPEQLTRLERTVSDAHTLAAIHALKAIKSPGRALPELQAVYRLNPGSRYLPLLVSREVNKLEDWILSPRALGFQSVMREAAYERQRRERESSSPYADTAYSYFEKKNRAKDIAYLHEVRSGLITMLHGKAKDKDMMRLAIAHLYYMEGRFGEVRKYLASMPAGPKDSSYAKQAAIEQALVTIYSGDLGSSRVKEALNKQFARLEALGCGIKPLPEEEDYYGTANKSPLRLLYLLLSRQYRERGDIVTAGLLFQRSGALVNDYYGFDDQQEIRTPKTTYPKIAYFDKYAAPADMDALLRFKAKNNKTPFEQRITPLAWAPDDFYRDLKGTLLVRRKDFRGALAVMNGMDDHFWENNYEYKDNLPRTAIAGAGTLLPVGGGPSAPYPLKSKKAVLRDIVALQDSLSTVRDAGTKARLCFLLGNAYYNISYYGKGWMMYSYGKSSREQSFSLYEDQYRWAWFSFYPNSIRYAATYYRCADAVAMYRRALAFAGKDSELAAGSLVMLSLCDRNARSYDKERGEYRNGIYREAKEGPPYYSRYLGTLRRKYGDTHTFAVCATECPDIEGYLKEMR